MFGSLQAPRRAGPHEDGALPQDAERPLGGKRAFASLGGPLLDGKGEPAGYKPFQGCPMLSNTQIVLCKQPKGNSVAESKPQKEFAFFGCFVGGVSTLWVQGRSDRWCQDWSGQLGNAGRQGRHVARRGFKLFRGVQVFDPIGSFIYTGGGCNLSSTTRALFFLCGAT